MPPDLAELVCRLRSGEPAAREAFAAAIRPELLRLARTRVRDRASADDIAQESLLEVLATIDALREPNALRAWLRLIVRKQADRVTRQRRPTAPLDSATPHADGSDGPERVAERHSDIATIRRALAVVRDADTLLLRLRYAGEWTDNELAELVDSTPGTVRKRVHDARGRLRSAVLSADPKIVPPQPEVAMTANDEFTGRIVTPGDVPAHEPFVGTGGRRRLETGLKILDAAVPIAAGGTVDLLGPAGLGQLVLVAEIAVHIDAYVVAAAAPGVFSGLVEEDDLDIRATVIEGDPHDAARAATHLASARASSGDTVLVVLDAPTWAAGVPATGVAPSGGGSVTAVRFAPHPRDGEPTAPLDDAGTTLVCATEPFIRGLYPAIDVLASHSALIDDDILDPVTVGAARTARQLLDRAETVRAFLAQPLIVAESYTGVPGVQVPALDATEALASLVR